MSEKVDARESKRVISTCTFSVIQEITNSSLNGAPKGLFLGLTNLQKQAYTFTNKSIYFYVCLNSWCALFLVSF